MISPFITSNPADARVLLENFGIAFYYAQLLEDNLKLILLMAELQRIVAFDRRKDLRIKDSDDGLIQACMGHLKQVLKRARAQNSDEFFALLDNANKARRSLAHRFFLEHGKDLLTEEGRAATNQHLSELYLTIRNAHNASVALRDAIYSRIGFTPEVIRQRAENSKRAMGEKQPRHR